MVQVTLSDPILSEGELSSLQAIDSLKPATLPTFFDVSDGIEGALQRGLDKLCEAADEAVRSGSQLLILSDRTDDMVWPLDTNLSSLDSFNDIFFVLIQKENFLDE